MKEREKKLEAALSDLVFKVEEMTKHIDFITAFALLRDNGVAYSGPSCKEELLAAKELLEVEEKKSKVASKLNYSDKVTN